MALVYRLENRCIVLVSQGHVEYEEGLQVFSAAIAQAQTSQFASWHILFDIMASEEDRSEEELRGIATFVATHKEMTKRVRRSAPPRRAYDPIGVHGVFYLPTPSQSKRRAPALLPRAYRGGTPCP
jgi:hypothetical protein